MTVESPVYICHELLCFSHNLLGRLCVRTRIVLPLLHHLACCGGLGATSLTYSLRAPAELLQKGILLTTNWLRLRWSGQVEREGAFGEGITADDLVPGGGDVPVTPSNRERFVELYTRHLLEGSIARQFSAFRRGFEQACSPSAPKKFHLGGR